VIVNGSSNRCVWWWTQHLESEVNEKVEIVKSNGLRGETIRDMLEEMQAMSSGTACENFFYQINMNPRPGERPTPEQWDRARKIAEKEHGLEGQPYFMVMHTKHGREHPHFIYFRVNLETGKTISDSYDARKNHAIAREIERELGLQKVIGPYDREPGTPRPERGPTRWEMYRGMKTDLDPRDVTAELTELRQQCDNGKAFQAALELRGYILAQGDRMVAGERALMIIDPAGNDHHLPRRIKGMNSTQVNEFMSDMDRAALPTLDRAKAQYQERKIAGLEADRASVKHEIEWEEALAKAAIEKEKIEGKFLEQEHRAGRTGAGRKQDQPEKETRAGREQAKPDGRKEKYWPINPPQPERKSPALFDEAATGATRDDRTHDLTGPAAQVWQAWRQIDPAKHEKEFAALDEHGIPFSVATDSKAFAAALDEKGIAFARATKDEAYRSDRQADFARAVGNRGQRFNEGEIVIVTEPRPEFRREGEVAEPRRRVHKLDQSLAKKFVKALGTGDTLQGIDATIKASDQRAQQRAADWQAIRLERAVNIKSAGRIRAGNAKDNLLRRPAAVLKPVAMGLNLIGKPLEILGNLFEPPVLTPEQKRAGEITARERQADVRDQLEHSNNISERAQERRQLDDEREAEQRARREREVDRGR
jgi:MobA/VirD2-like, nuclease domain